MVSSLLQHVAIDPHEIIQKYKEEYRVGKFLSSSLKKVAKIKGKTKKTKETRTFHIFIIFLWTFLKHQGKRPRPTAWWIARRWRKRVNREVKHV